jgi:hypothetical protein
MIYVNIIKIDLNIKTYFISSGQINYEAIIWIDHPAQRFSLAYGNAMNIIGAQG